MLVLTRKLKEEIRINENIVITVLKIRGQNVQLGIVAPRDVTITRPKEYDMLICKSA